MSIGMNTITRQGEDMLRKHVHVGTGCTLKINGAACALEIDGEVICTGPIFINGRIGFGNGPRGFDNPDHWDHDRYQRMVNRVGIVGMAFLYWIAFTMALTSFRTFDLAYGLSALTVLGIGYGFACLLMWSYDKGKDSYRAFTNWLKGY